MFSPLRKPMQPSLPSPVCRKMRIFSSFAARESVPLIPSWLRARIISPTSDGRFENRYFPEISKNFFSAWYARADFNRS